MADGQEEREEQKQRREETRRQDREDWMDRSGGDESAPERRDS